MKLSPEDNKLVQEIAANVADPMARMLKKHKNLVNEMITYSFELGQKLGYMAGYSEGKANMPYRADCTPEAFRVFVEKVKH